LEKFIAILDEKHPGNGSAVELLISDFEAAILSSMERAFPNYVVRHELVSFWSSGF